MVINLFGAATPEAASQTSSINPQGSGSPSGVSNSPTQTTEDTTSLSASGSVQSLTQTALQTFPTRAERVQALQQAVNEGQYQLDADKIALAMSSSDL